MTVNFESYFNADPERKQWLAGSEAIREELCADVYSGPHYLCEPSESPYDPITYSGITIGTCLYGDGVDVTGDLFNSQIHKKLVYDIESMDFPKYYDADCDWFGDTLPEGEYINSETFEPCDEDSEGAIWSEPYLENTYEIEPGDWYEFLFSHSTWRDIIG